MFVLVFVLTLLSLGRALPSGSKKGPFFSSDFVEFWGREVNFTGNIDPTTGLANGDGIGTTANKDDFYAVFVFEGTFKNGEMSGDGQVQEHIDNVNNTRIAYSYTGQWEDGVPEGEGTEISALEQYRKPNQKLIYVGEFSLGKRNGYGEATYSWCVEKPTWCKEYKGEWQNGLRHGEGNWISCRGHKYVGSFKEDDFDNGRYDWPDGGYYEGPFKNNKRHGQNGKQVYPNGNSYEGPWKEGKYHGDGGTVTFKSSGMTYVGRWEDGHGVGEHSFTTKDGKTGRARAEKTNKGTTRWGNI